MAEKRKSKKTNEQGVADSADTVEVIEKKKKRVPLKEAIHSVGELPFRTYEMMRNSFVGIN